MDFFSTVNCFEINAVNIIGYYLPRRGSALVFIIVLKQSVRPIIQLLTVFFNRNWSQLWTMQEVCNIKEFRHDMPSSEADIILL